MIPWDWNTTPEERVARLPCDGYLSMPFARLSRAITIAAPPETIFRSLRQLKVEGFGTPVPLALRRSWCAFPVVNSAIRNSRESQLDETGCFRKELPDEDVLYVCRGAADRNVRGLLHSRHGANVAPRLGPRSDD